MRRLPASFVALLLLALLSPLFLALAIAVRVSSPGPVIYRQARVGSRGEPFVLYKFRTMLVGSDKDPRIVLPGDGRVTRVGRVLRAYHLDELPQLVNIAKGEMGFVGPRPMPFVLAKPFENHPAYRVRTETLPGLTGLVQVRGRLWALRRGGRATLRLDAFYARRATPALDARILWETVRAVLSRKGV